MSINYMPGHGSFNPIMRAKKSFTLIELIVVIVVLSIGLTTLLMLLRMASLNNAEANFITVVAELAEGKLEEILADRKEGTFAGITNGNYPTETFDSYSIGTNIYNVQGPDNLDTPGGTNYKRIDVTVTKTAIPNTLTLSTVVTDY